MAFEPYKITQEHILKAAAHVKANGLELKPSTRWEVIIQDESYPPREILRYAHAEMNGEYIWLPGGGYNPNAYLENLGNFDNILIIPVFA